MSDSPKTLTAEEAGKLLSELTGEPLTLKQETKAIRNYCLALLMLDAGLRVGEAVQLRYSDLYFNGEPLTSLTVRQEIAKNHRERIVPVSERLTAGLVCMHRRLNIDCIYQSNSYVTNLRTCSKPLSTRQVERIIKNAAMKSLGRPIHPHVLRHTFASRLMRTTNARVVQELLGHKNLTSTQIYTHPNHEDLKKAIDGLAAIPNLNGVNRINPSLPAGVSNSLDTS